MQNERPKRTLVFGLAETTMGLALLTGPWPPLQKGGHGIHFEIFSCQVIMIGDDITDVQCGLNANSQTIHINIKSPADAVDSPAHHVVTTLTELHQLLEDKYNLLPSIK